MNAILGQILDNQKLLMEKIEFLESRLVDQNRTGGYEFAEGITGKNKRTLYAYVANDKIPYEIKAGKVLFYEAELKEWMKAKHGTKDAVALNIMAKRIENSVI